MFQLDSKKYVLALTAISLQPKRWEPRYLPALKELLTERGNWRVQSEQKQSKKHGVKQWKTKEAQTCDAEGKHVVFSEPTETMHMLVRQPWRSVAGDGTGHVVVVLMMVMMLLLASANY